MNASPEEVKAARRARAYEGELAVPDNVKIAVAVVEDYETEPRLQRVVENRLDTVKALFERLDAGYST